MIRIKELREKKGINMRQTAKELGIPYTTYISYEKGDREPNSEMLIELAEFFHCSIDYLLGRSEDVIDTEKWDEEAEEHAKKLVARELVRLRKSFDLAKADGFRKFIMFLHYPPTNILEERSGFTDMAEEYGAEQVIYAHSHGESRFHDSIHGEYRGRVYHLVSGDYLRWKPLKVLE